MQLDEEKTKITHAADGYKFLGFEVRLNIKNPKLKRVLQKNQKGQYVRVLKRTTSRQLIIEPDSNKILQRLKLLKFCNNKYEPRAKPSWIVYNEFQIVQKYAQVFRGIFDYYRPCERLTRLARISYILQYSCARALARRKKVSMKKIFEMYGKMMLIKTTIKGTKTESTRVVRFFDLTTLRKMPKINSPTLINKDPFRIQEHWRTKFKMYNECFICGETSGIALHHNNSVSSIKGKDKFVHIRMTINRLQMPICDKCHNEITWGKFNNPKKPIEFFNEFLAKL